MISSKENEIKGTTFIKDIFSFHNFCPILFVASFENLGDSAKSWSFGRMNNPLLQTYQDSYNHNLLNQTVWILQFYQGPRNICSMGSAEPINF